MTSNYSWDNSCVCTQFVNIVGPFLEAIGQWLAIYKCVDPSLNNSLILSFLVPLVRLISMLGLKAVDNISIGNTIPYPSLNHAMNLMTSIYLYAANVWQTLPRDHKVLHRHTTSNVVEQVLYCRQQFLYWLFLVLHQLNTPKPKE